LIVTYSVLSSYRPCAFLTIAFLFQSMFGDWEKYKVAVESSRQPELMLIVEKWQQLQFVPRDYFAKYVPIMYFVVISALLSSNFSIGILQKR